MHKTAHASEIGAPRSSTLEDVTNSPALQPQTCKLEPPPIWWEVGPPLAAGSASLEGLGQPGGADGAAARPPAGLHLDLQLSAKRKMPDEMDLDDGGLGSPVEVHSGGLFDLLPPVPMAQVVADGLALPPLEASALDMDVSTESDLPATPPQEPVVSIRFGERSADFDSLRGLTSPQICRQIAARFGLSANFTLRAGASGCIVPVSLCASGAGDFVLEIPGYAPEAPPVSITNDGKLRWVQQPPHSSCQWLTAKPNDGVLADGSPRVLHCFDPAPKISFRGVETAELTAQLAQVKVSLWTSQFREVSEHLHCGPCEVRYLEGGSVTLEWTAMGVTELPSNVAAAEPGCGPAAVPPVAAGRVQNSHRGGRGGNGWFHLKIEAPGLGQLWLLDSANNPARIILKHRRCVDTGRWRQREIGPYADHSRCRAAGSHIALDGSKLCGECMCFAAKKKRRVVKSEPAVAALAMPVLP